MKDHRVTQRHLSIYDIEGPVSGIEHRLEELAKGIVDPKLVVNGGYEDVELLIVGWIPLTPEEILKEQTKRERAAKAAKEAALRKKTTEIDRLKQRAEKLGFTLKEK